MVPPLSQKLTLAKPVVVRLEWFNPMAPQALVMVTLMESLPEWTGDVVA